MGALTGGAEGALGAAVNQAATPLVGTLTEGIENKTVREIVRESRRFDVAQFRILASPSVIDLFLDEESQSLAMLIDFIGKPISLAVENSYTQEQYDVVII